MLCSVFSAGIWCLWYEQRCKSSSSLKQTFVKLPSRDTRNISEQFTWPSWVQLVIGRTTRIFFKFSSPWLLFFFHRTTLKQMIHVKRVRGLVPLVVLKYCNFLIRLTLRWGRLETSQTEWWRSFSLFRNETVLTTCLLRTISGRNRDVYCVLLSQTKVFYAF